MQMLNVLILVSIGLAIIGFIYSIIADKMDGMQGFGFIVGLTFYILAAVFWWNLGTRHWSNLWCWWQIPLPG